MLPTAAGRGAAAAPFVPAKKVVYEVAGVVLATGVPGFEDVAATGG